MGRLPKEKRFGLFAQKLGIELPIIQAPMAGVSTPEMAAAVSNAGALGSIGVAAVDAETTRQMIVAVRTRTDRPFNVNVFCHPPAVADTAREAAWLARLGSEFARYRRAAAGTADGDLSELSGRRCQVRRPLGRAAGDRQFSLRRAGTRADRAPRAAGIRLFATATSSEEGKAIAAAGIDAVVAQGYEAGGHRGIFDPDGADEQLGTVALTRFSAKELDVPGDRGRRNHGRCRRRRCASAGGGCRELGTAFVACPESSADAGYRAALLGPAAEHTVVTRAISGRPARCIANRFTALGAEVEPERRPGLSNRLRRGESGCTSPRNRWASSNSGASGPAKARRLRVPCPRPS